MPYMHITKTRICLQNFNPSEIESSVILDVAFSAIF